MEAGAARPESARCIGNLSTSCCGRSTTTSGGDFNLLIVYIHSGGGDLNQSVRLAENDLPSGAAIHTRGVCRFAGPGRRGADCHGVRRASVTADAMLGGPGERADRTMS